MDKREAVRVPVRVHARCRTDNGVVVDGFVEDLSRSGMFVALEDELVDDDHPARFAEGSQTMIALDLPGEDQPLQLEAEVVRVEPVVVGRTRTGVGLRIVDETSARPLANFIMKQAQERLS